MLRRGNLRAEKVQYGDGIGCCIWRPFKGSSGDMGSCWDFALDELDDILALLTELRDAPAEPMTENEEWLAVAESAFSDWDNPAEAV